MSKPILIFDTECYRNWFLLAFRNIKTGNVRNFELYEGHPLDIPTIREILSAYRVIGFNSNNYDMPQIYHALTGADNAALKASNEYIITGGYKSWHCEAQFKFKISTKVDHIDLIEIAVGKASLKGYGGRLHTKVIQDLPISPDDSISPEQREELKRYCAHDLKVTEELYTYLMPQIELREEMSKRYDMNLLSKSDSQVAEAIIKKEVSKLKSCELSKPNTNIRPFKYKKPIFISFETEQLQKLLDIILASNFVVTDSGKVILPKEISDSKIKLAGSEFTVGIGGLHSVEETVSYQAGEDFVILDADCTSFYPTIMLNNNLYPESMGKEFLTIYRNIFNKRIEAKKSGDKVTAECYKIQLNGGWGKHGSKYSVFYSPSVIIQTTITGQLSLLMLIEQLALNGIRVISANTDGLVMFYPKKDEEKVHEILSGWEMISGFTLEETRYKSLFSRDVNNFFAFKLGGGHKLKGAYSPAGLQKNPTNEICSEAVVKFLDKGVPIEDTINGCKDIRKFITIRSVKGGAVKDGVFLGKTCRWYYSHLAFGDIKYKINNYTVARSEGAMPCMTLPDEFPDDVDTSWYVKEAYKILEEIGCAKVPSKTTSSNESKNSVGKCAS